MIYLDNAATTKICEKAVKAMEPYLKEEYGNPSGIYSIGRKTREQVEKVRWTIAKSLNCKPENIFFTSGGTESDNWVLDNGAYLGNHIITSKIEHHAILNKCKQLENEGIKVTYVDVDKNGFVDMEQIKTDYKDGFENPVRTSLVSIMLANNEIGTIEPVREIGEIAHKHGILFHTDAVQAMCHVPINVTEMNIDLLSASAHKFHGPKGVGFMYMKNTAKLEPFIHGGAQERARRAGTSNVPGIVGMGQAVKLALCTLDKDTHTIINMRNYIVDRILGEIPDVTFDGPCIDANADVNAVSVGLPMCSLNRLPSNMHFCFKDVSGDSLLIMLDMNGICASSGSACAAGSIAPSHVLLAIGRSSDEAKGALRLSIDKDLTKEDADYAIDALKAAVARLRR